MELQIFHVISVLISYASCSITGISYIDGLIQKPLEQKEDPCNPLYWYPREIPEYCYKSRIPDTPAYDPPPPPPPIPVPIPIPVPNPVPIPVPPPPPNPCHDPKPSPPIKPMPCLPPMPMPAPFMPMPMQPPIPVFPTPPLPYGIPLIPTNPMVPIGGYPYPYIPGPPVLQRGLPGSMVPGVNGIVSPDGGINILPFSDTYTDLMEKHRQKMITKKLERLIKEYDNKSYRRKNRGRKSRGRMDFEE